MNISFVADSNADEYVGGAEKIFRKFSNHCKKQGWGGKEYTRKTFKVEKVKDDLIFLGNTGLYADDELEAISKLKYVYYQADYGFCRLIRSGLCEACPYHLKSKCPPHIHRKLIENAQFNVFLGPTQKELFEHRFGKKIKNSMLYFPFYYPVEKYKPMGLDRIKNSVIYPHRICELKGHDEMIQVAVNNPGALFFFIRGEFQYSMPFLQKMMMVKNCVYLGTPKQKSMPHIFNLMERAMYLGRWRDTGPVSMVEAYLCGCEIKQRNATIFDWGFKNREECVKLIKKSDEELWKAVAKLQ